MRDLLSISSTQGLNLALLTSWEDAPDGEPPTLCVRYAAGAVGADGFQPATEYYTGEARRRLLAYLTTHALSV